MLMQTLVVRFNCIIVYLNIFILYDSVCLKCCDTALYRPEFLLVPVWYINTSRL